MGRRGHWLRADRRERQPIDSMTKRHRPPKRISIRDLRTAERAFSKYEGRDSMYRVATFLLKEWWGQHELMTDALSVLLLTWNSAFYRGATFRSERLERCLRKNWREIQRFRRRNILSLRRADRPTIRRVFVAVLIALERRGGRARTARSPVGTAKALHLLAPRFFPIWDSEIAWQYGCVYSDNPAEAYFKFCKIMQQLAADLAPRVSKSQKPLLKRIDEYNYAKYTQGWV